MTTIEIHEFSTGIIAKGTPDNWWSEGFNGYMNSTLEKIPQAIADEIAHDLFNITEGKSSDTPGMIGREVQKVTYQVDKNGQRIRNPQTGNFVERSREEWSVIAVVTSGKDEKGRTGSFYRYFLTKGLGNLETLIRWWMKDERPTFAPFNVPPVGQPSIYQISQTNQANDPISKQEFQQLLNTTEKTILIPHNLPSVPIIVNALATRKAAQNNKSVAWACDVQGLRRPQSFSAIYPIDENAENAIRKQLSVTDDAGYEIPGEKPVRSAIDYLSNQKPVPADDVQEIEDALNDPLFTSSSWENRIFKKLNIQRAKDDQEYLDKYVRLYFLYALILPEKLLEFLDWLGAASGKTKNNAFETSQTLSQRIYGRLRNQEIRANNGQKQWAILNCVKAGIQKIIDTLSTQSDLSGATLSDSGNMKTLYCLLKLFNIRDQSRVIIWLFRLEGGLWSNQYLPYEEYLRSYGETYKHQLYNDLFEITRNYEQRAEPHRNLQRLNNTYLRPLRDYFSQLIGYHQGKTKGLGLNRDKRNLLEDLAKIFEATIEYKRQNNQEAAQEYDYKLLAVINQILHGFVETSLWKECGWEVRLGKQDVHRLSPPDLDRTTIVLYRKPPRKIPWWLIFILGLATGVLAYHSYITYVAQLYSKIENLETDKQTLSAILFDIPEIETIVNNFEKFFEHPKEETKQVIIQRCTQPAEGQMDCISLIEDFRKKPDTPQNPNPNATLFKQNLDRQIVAARKQKETKAQESSEQKKDNVTKSDNQFESITIPVLNKIVDDIEAIAKKQKVIKNKDDVQKELVGIIKNPNSGRNLSFETISDTNQHQEWIDTIKEYQGKQKAITIKQTGIIDKGSDTDKILRCQLREKLGVKSEQNKVLECKKFSITIVPKTDAASSQGTVTPVPSPKPNSTPALTTSTGTWEETIQSLDRLRDEFVDSGISKNQAEETIVKNLAPGYVYKYMPTNQDNLWSIRIKELQQANTIPPTGYITQNDETYNVLKCKMAQTLNLTEEFPECPIN